MVVWTVLVTLGVFVCVLSAWMSRLGHGGVSKCYAPITAFHAQSPDHIPNCYLTVHTDCLSLYSYLSVTAFIRLAYTSFFQLVGAPTRPGSSQRHPQTFGAHAPSIPLICSCEVVKEMTFCSGGMQQSLPSLLSPTQINPR